MKQRILDEHREYLALTQRYDQCYDEHAAVSQQIRLKYQALDAFRETVTVFEDQIKLHETYQPQAAQHEIHK